MFKTLIKSHLSYSTAKNEIEIMHLTYEAVKFLMEVNKVRVNQRACLLT